MTCHKNNTKVPDNQFLSPDQLNKLKGVVSDRFLHRVKEKVKILAVCQDESTPNLVYIDFSLNGVFDYTPSCEILKVDDDNSYTAKKIVAPLVLSYWRNNPKSLPINTQCKTQNYTLAFDFGRVIDNFITAKEITFRIKMVGKLPARLKLPEFRLLEKTIFDTMLWKKGPTTTPYTIEYDQDHEKLAVYFLIEDGVPCICNAICKNLSGDKGTITYCEDKLSRVIVDYAGSGDPSTFLFSFTDNIGNKTDINIDPVINLTPAKPTVVSAKSPRRIEIYPIWLTDSGKEIKGAEAYQIWRYEGEEANLTLWKDWSYRKEAKVIDRDIKPGTLYGYAIAFRGKYGDISNPSEWAIVVAEE